MRKLRIRLLVALPVLWLSTGAILYAAYALHRLRAESGHAVRSGTADAAPPGAASGLRRELLIAAGGGLAAFSVALGLSHGVVTLLVIRPLRKISERVGTLNGLGASGPAGGPVGDLDELGAALEAAQGREDALLARVAALSSHLCERGAGAQEALRGARESLDAEREAAEAVRCSVGHLGETAEQTRESFKAIATSASDNSTSLTEMSASVDEVARNADELARHVVSTSASVVRMVDSIGEVTDRVEALAREIDVTASSMAQIDASTRQIEENARQAAALSGRMAETAREGSLAVQETLQGIHLSHDVMRETVHAMEELGVASKAIDGVVKIINDINDKTKLLSLNAAIIAAQAGDHGKSFAVVAHEVQRLSERTVASTSEISRIVRGIRDQMGAATEAVNRGQRETGHSVELAERAGRTLQRILSTAQVSHDMTRQILQATEEQSRGSQSVMTSMHEVSAMVGYIREAAREHRASGARVTESTEVMSTLTEHVRMATAEQAEVSRYLSEAIAAMDQNLRTLLGVVDQIQEDVDGVVGHSARLRGISDDRRRRVCDAGGLIEELQRQIRGLDNRAAASCDPPEGGGPV